MMCWFFLFCFVFCVVLFVVEMFCCVDGRLDL